MNYDFLRSFTITTITNGNEAGNYNWNNPEVHHRLPQTPPHNSMTVMRYNDSAAGCGSVNQNHRQLQPVQVSMADDHHQQPVHHFRHPHQYTPAFHGTNYAQPWCRPPQKRKYNGLGNHEGPPKQPEKILEVDPDGKLVMFQGRDISYPDDLNRLIHPLTCELCRTQMNSMHSAKDHYESKVHDRSIVNWLKKNYTEKGLEPPPVKRFVSEGGPSGPDAYYCELCDLKLTSLTHANQHYSGRRHRLVADGVSKPSGAGFYNVEGKWIRTGTKSLPTVANDGRFGIGELHRAQVDINVSQEVTACGPTNNKVENAIEEHQLSVNSGGQSTNDALYCNVCKVQTTSWTQMSTHLIGAKHRKKLKALGFEESPSTLQAEVGSAAVAAVCLTDESAAPNTILASLSAQPELSGDLSMYRTPTGSYYCKPCNMSMTHVTVLQQHLNGKKHIKKVAEEKAKM